MVKTALVEQDIEDGRKLIKALEQADLPVDAALWLYLPEPEEWRFMIASPLVDQKGSREVYAFVQSVLKKMSPSFRISLSNVAVVSPSYGLVQSVRQMLRANPNKISDLRFTKNVIDHQFVEDAYIYHMA
jgi:hypothetical protein